MKFNKASANIVREWPVEVRAPGDDGKMTGHTIHIDYKILTREEQRKNLEREAKKSAKRMEGGKSALVDMFSKKTIAASDKELTDRIIGWDLEDENGEPLPFNQVNLKAVLALGYLAKPIGEGLLAASNGAPEKN